jgi:beta-xylosidase
MKKIASNIGFIMLLLAMGYQHTFAQGNPVLSGADPHAVVFGKEYWIYPTNGADTGLYRRSDRFFSYSSTDLSKWQRRGTLLTIDEIKWIKDDGAQKHSLWAPAMIVHKGKYYLYYSVGPQNPTPSRIGVAISNSPATGFKDSGKPLLTGGNGFEAIDPMVFVDPKSKNTYLYCGGSAGAKLRVFQLKKNLIEIDHEIPVEQPPLFTEGVFMHERNGIYYLSYSHGKWDNNTYSVHYGTSSTPFGPWQYHGTMLVSDAKHIGPGHHSFITNPSTGQWYIVYHRWTDETNGKGPLKIMRKTAIEPIIYNADGTIAQVVMTDSAPTPSPIK